MKVCKIMTITALALTVALSSVTFGQGVYAAENSTNSTVIQNNTTKITADTVITKDNIYDVLSYVGLDSKSLSKTNAISSNSTIKTVGELEKLVKKAKSNPTKIVAKNNTNTNTNTNTKTNIVSSSLLAATNGSKTIAQNFDNGSYTLKYKVSAQYSGSEWVGVTSPDVSVTADVDKAGITYKIDSDPSLDATWEPDVITMTSYVTVDEYIGVKDVGLVCIGYQGVSSTNSFYASDYL